MRRRLICITTESLRFIPIAPRIDATQVKAATPSVAKRKRAIQDTNSERQEPASKAFKNEPIGGSSLDTIDLRDDENDDKNEDDYESDMWEADNAIHPYDYRPAITPTVIDLEDSVKDEEESNTVAPQVVLYADQNPATDVNFITFPAASATDTDLRLRIGVWAPNSFGGGAWLPLHDLSPGDGRVIHAIFNRVYMSHPKISTMYRSIVRDAERFMQRGMCVCHYLYRGTGASKYTSAEGDKDRACDHCNGRMRLCVRVILDTMGPKLCVLPLHDKFRAGQTSISLGAYVRLNGVLFKFGEKNARRTWDTSSFSISQ